MKGRRGFVATVCTLGFIALFAAKPKRARASGCSVVFGVVNVGGASSGTIEDAAITEESTILLTTQRDVSETALPFVASANLVGFPRTGEVDWELNCGHDNNVYLHYAVYNPE